MKKIIAIAMAAVMLTALAVSAAATEFYASSALVDKVVVDGLKDEAYVSAPIPIDYQAEAGAATGVAYAAWDNEYLYLFAEVQDDTVQNPNLVVSLWCDDNVEFYINLSGKEGKITEINAAQYTLGPSFFEFAGGGLHREKNVDNCTYAYTYTDTGYTVEVALVWGDEYTPAADATIDFCAAVCDNADGISGTREYQTFTGANQASAWEVADSAWDSLTLTTEAFTAPETEAETVEENVDAPEADAPQTFDAGIIAAVAAIVSAAGYALSKKR